MVYFRPLAAILQAHPAVSVPVTTFLVLTSFGIGLPATIALFPQIASIDAQAVEAEPFQQLINPVTKQPYTKFFYNKGL
jgi:sideroflexin-5